MSFYISGCIFEILNACIPTKHAFVCLFRMSMDICAYSKFCPLQRLIKFWLTLYRSPIYLGQSVYRDDF